MKYIQSFYQYPVTFESIGRTVPCKDAEGELRNIAEFSEEELEKLQNQEPFFRELVNMKKFRILNHLPESYRSAATLVNEANDRAAKAEAELAALKAQMAQQETAEGAAPADQKPEEGGQTAEGAAPAESGEAADPKPFDEWDYKELQAWAKDHGVENVNVKKAELVKACKALTGSDE